MPRPLIVLDGVTIRLADRQVFARTSWTFARDQQWALVGANGSGKSLFARALTGELPVVGGEIRYFFRRPPGGRPWVPEDAVVHLSFEHQKAVAGEAPAAVRWSSLEEEAADTVRGFLSQDSVEDVNPFEVVSRSARSAETFILRQRRVLRRLQIENLADRRLPSLSTGEMRKILVARALLRQPQLLILDDPFSGLDTHFRVHLKRMLEAMIRHGSPHLLLVVNHLDELPRGVTHVLHVERCRVAAQGPRRAMLTRAGVRGLFEVPQARRLRHAPGLQAGRRHHEPGLRAERLRDASAPRATRLRHAPALQETRLRQPAIELVRLEGVTVRYGARSILTSIDWTVRRGEHWALIGPNGAGKSTLLSLIVGDNPQAYANTVLVFGRQRGTGEDLRQVRRRIGWVSSELHLHFPDTETCLGAVVSGFLDTHGCFTLPSSRQARHARQWLARFGLADHADRPLGSLSAGLQRMTLLARAMVKAPDLLVFDEPCQGLDQAHRTLFLDAVESLTEANAATVIYVTHRKEEIPSGINRVLHLRQGRVTGCSRLRVAPGLGGQSRQRTWG